MSKNSPNNTTDLLERPKTHSEETPEHTIRCAHCAHTITTSHQRIEVEGKHVHNFMNPEGFAFQIGCFRNAVGLRPVDMPSAEFSWFRGFFWQIEVCKQCHTHLGWSYENEQEIFYGLILPRLTQ
ncbi:MAG: hypothetical protein CL920_15255 [Deltaproteobacteria bacterium]|nr:hypothetical protein [Deltaproteobacteria bacterium]